MGHSRFNFSAAEKETHLRIALQYAAIAQGSTIAVLLAIAALRQFWHWRTCGAPLREGNLKASRKGSFWDKAKWCLTDDVYYTGMNLCRPDELILGVILFIWLMFLSGIGKIDEPFSLASLPQDLRDFRKLRLLRLPDATAFHISHRLALIAASQWPFLPILRLKRNSPLQRLLRCSHMQLARYRGVLSAIIYLLLLLHAVVQLLGMDFEVLNSGSWKLQILGYLGLYLLLIIMQRLGARQPILSLVVSLAYLLAFMWLIWNHTVAARGYILQTLLIFILTLMLQSKTRPFILKQPTPEAQAAAQAAINPVPITQDEKSPFIILRSEKASDLFNIDEGDSTADKKRIIVAAIVTKHGLLVRLLIWLWSIISSKLAIDTRNSQNRDKNITIEDASTPTLPSEEEVRLSIRIEGSPNPLGEGMTNLMLFNPDQVLFITGGIAGFLAYPSYFTYVAAQRKKRDICSARVIATGNSSSGASCAIPRRLLDNDASQDDKSGDLIVMRLDTELLKDTEGETTTSIHRPGIAKNSCSLTGDCSHSSLCEVIDRFMRRNHGDSVAVVVMGPDKLDQEARRAMRPWVLSGHKIWWLFETFGI